MRFAILHNLLDYSNPATIAIFGVSFGCQSMEYDSDSLKSNSMLLVNFNQCIFPADWDDAIN